MVSKKNCQISIYVSFLLDTVHLPNQCGLGQRMVIVDLGVYVQCTHYTVGGQYNFDMGKSYNIHNISGLHAYIKVNHIV